MACKGPGLQGRLRIPMYPLAANTYATVLPPWTSWKSSLPDRTSSTILRRQVLLESASEDVATDWHMVNSSSFNCVPAPLNTLCLSQRPSSDPEHGQREELSIYSSFIVAFVEIFQIFASCICMFCRLGNRIYGRKCSKIGRAHV